MIYSKVIIVGGGPAGSSCGWKLRQNGIECLILDKQEFPRTKSCAGWITPQVFTDLKINENDYPHSLTKLNGFQIHVHGKRLNINVQQSAIRRHEFDHWLLRRSGVAVSTHEVKGIKKDGDGYVVDDQYGCRYLVGAGGTHCPVYRTLFKPVHPKAKDLLVVALVEEFPYDYRDGNCHLWFLHNKLPGYSWYVPKSDGYLNVGIGGFAERLKSNNDDIKKQWQMFTGVLERLSLVKDHRFNAKGYTYTVRNRVDAVQIDGAFLIGDAAGLATRDMGEGIGPAVISGILAADAITSGKPFSLSSVKKYSFPRFRTFAKLFSAYLLSPRDKVK